MKYGDRYLSYLLDQVVDRNVMSVETMNIWLEFGADLLDDEAGQDVHDEASQSWIHGERLDDGTHEQHGERTLLHQLLHHHRQNL